MGQLVRNQDGFEYSCHMKLKQLLDFLLWPFCLFISLGFYALSLTDYENHTSNSVPLLSYFLFTSKSSQQTHLSWLQLHHSFHLTFIDCSEAALRLSFLCLSQCIQCLSIFSFLTAWRWLKYYSCQFSCQNVSLRHVPKMTWTCYFLLLFVSISPVSLNGMGLFHWFPPLKSKTTFESSSRLISYAL